MDVMDWVILASMGVLVVFFACAAVMEWMDAREGSDAQVIQHPGRDTRASAA